MSPRAKNKPKPLTAEQRRCLAILKEHGLLIRYGHGWQRPNAPLKKKWFTDLPYYEQGIPVDLVQTNVVTRLLELGLIQAAPGFENLPDCPLPPKLILSPPLTPAP